MAQDTVSKSRKCNECYRTFYFTSAEMKQHGLNCLQLQYCFGCKKALRMTPKNHRAHREDHYLADMKERLAG